MRSSTVTNFEEITSSLPEHEQIFLAIWGGRAVQEAQRDRAVSKGAFVYTPHVVMSPAAGGGLRPVLIEPTDVPAPVWVFGKGITKVRWTAAYRTGAQTHWRATGYFHVGVGIASDDLPPVRVKIEPQRGSKVPAPDRASFPANVSVPAPTARDFRKQTAEVLRRADDGWRHLFKERTVLWGYRQVREKAAGRYADGTGVFDMDDTLQEYRRQVTTEAIRHASYRRHDCTWTEVVKANCVREPWRRYNETRPEPQIINEIRAWLSGANIPLTLSPAEVRAIKARDTEIVKWRKRHPEATAAEADAAVPRDVDARRCRWTEDQIRRAMEPPTSVGSIDVPVGDSEMSLKDFLVASDDQGIHDVDRSTMETVEAMADALNLTVAEVVAIALARRAYTAEEFPPSVVEEAAAIRRNRQRFAAVADRLSAQFGPDGPLRAVTRGAMINGRVTYKSVTDIGEIVASNAAS